MDKLVAIFGAAAFAAALTGCMSTEEMLASNDPEWRTIGQYRLWNESLRTTREDRFAAIERIEEPEVLRQIANYACDAYTDKYGREVPSTIDEGAAAVAKLSGGRDLAIVACSAIEPSVRAAALEKETDQEWLVEIAKQSSDGKIRAGAMERLSAESLAAFPYSPAVFPYWRKITDQTTLAKIYRDRAATAKPEELEAIAACITDQGVLAKLVTPPTPDEWDAYNESIKKLEGDLYKAKEEQKDGNHEANCASSGDSARYWRNEAEKAQAKAGKLAAQLAALRSYGSNILFVSNDVARAGLYGNIADPSVLVNMINARPAKRWSNDRYYFTDLDQLLPIVGHLPDEEAEKIAMSRLEDFEIRSWGERRTVPMFLAANIAKSAKDPKTKLRVAHAVIEKIAGFREYCKDAGWIWWTKDDDKTADEIISAMSLSDTEKCAILCMGGLAWRRLIDSVDSATAAKALSTGRVKSEELEKALAGKIETNDIDMKLYAAVKSDEAKSALSKKMPASLKKQAAAEAEKAYAALAAKAQEASKSTFVLDGFYLGMTLEDAKKVYLHHFPDREVALSEDGFNLLVPGQGNPLCRRYTDENSVYQFNFGKSMLKKWYKFDAGSFGKWAAAYARATGIDMDLDFLERDGQVGSFNGSEIETYSAALHQETYRGRNASKDFVVTYFGEPEYTAFGGGWAAKELAKEKWKWVGADAGTLRVEIDK